MSNQPESWRRLTENILENVQDKKKAQLELVLAHIILYLQRVFLGASEKADSEVCDYPLFDARRQPLSYELGKELEYRLHRVASFGLADGNRAIELLTAGLFPQTPLTLNRRQTELLTTQQVNPESGTVALANILGISPRIVKREKQQLFSKYEIRNASMLDPQRFKLNHYCIQFRTKSTEASQAFDTWIRTKALKENQLPFLLGCGWDVNIQDGCLLLYSPNQTSWNKTIHRLLENIQEQFFVTTDIHQIKGCYAHINFDYYDHVSKEWRVLSDVQTEGLAQFLGQHGEQFAPLRGFDYNKNPIVFNKADWLLALALSESLLTRKERTHLLSKYGFPLSEKTVWTHERHLKRVKTLFPSIVFSHLTFEDVLCVITHSDEAILPNFNQLISQYAMSRLYPTDKGAIIFIGIPSGGASLMKQLTLTILNISDIQTVSVLRFKRDIPQGPALSTVSQWNASTQQWKEPSKP
ncbi:MAG: hypothetical protein ACFE8O_00060 [Candidatus Hermodarchaeota archaeon]